MEKNKTEIIANAIFCGFREIEVCDNARGYPSGLTKAIVGFENFNQAQEFAKENDLDVCLFKIRDGHHFHHSLGTTFEPLTYIDYLNDLGDNYRIFDFDTEFKAAMENLDCSDANIDDYKNVIMQFEEYREIASYIDNDSILIYNSESKTIEEVKKVLMGYNEDVYNYIIGVAL